MIPVYVRFAVALDDGSVAIMSVTLDDGRGIKRELSDEVVFREIVRAFAIGPQPTGYHQVFAEDLPTDRTYRNAWTVQNKQIVHDMSKAREIHLAAIRDQRNRKLNDLDKVWLQAATTKVDTTAIEAEMQALRDFPQTIEATLAAASTIEELKAIKLPE